jgi:hypothetical protein
MNIPQGFTSNEKKIINEIATQLVDSLTRLGDKGHPLFDESLDIFDEIREVDLMDTLVAKMIVHETVSKDPDQFVKLPVYDLRLSQQIITDLLKHVPLPNAKRNLLKKIEAIIQFKTINEN